MITVGEFDEQRRVREFIQGQRIDIPEAPGFDPNDILCRLTAVLWLQ